MKKIYLGTNTKMNKTIEQTESYLRSLCSLTADIDPQEVELFVIPSFTALYLASRIISESNIVLGAQNMCWEDEGQYTGEISPLMLKEVGVRIVEIGHSERRQIFGETDEMENWKVRCSLNHDLYPLLCIGETETEKNDGRAEHVCISQLQMGLNGVPIEKASMLRIAYEPVWAIGVRGKPVTVEYMTHMSETIRTELIRLFGYETAMTIPVLYGGSVNNENAVPFSNVPHINGLFIGRSAWNADNFNDLIRSILSHRQL